MSSGGVGGIRENGRTPRHVAVIMDGNGRWALSRGLDRSEGHLAGMDALTGMVEAAVEVGVEVLSLYAFSIDNWRRPSPEVEELMRILQLYAESESGRLQEHGVEVRALGQIDRLDPASRRAVRGIETETRGGGAMIMQVLISYGGREEILEAARSLARKAVDGAVSPEGITLSDFARELGPPEVPEPDLLIRTGGEFRLSNFMLWQLAYAEIYVTDILWPDFTKNDFFKAIADFRGRERRFGRVAARAGHGR